MKILIVNDDGIHSKGLHALASALHSLGEVWIVAPEKPQNAVGRAITLHKPLRLQSLKRRVFAVNGTPADCVVLGLGQLFQSEKPGLLVSGINKGLNLGDDVSNSGTVSAAMEALAKGIPSMAISVDGGPHYSFSVASVVAKIVAKMILDRSLPKETMVNVNVPKGRVQDLKGLMVTTLCRRLYEDPISVKTDPRGEQYYWIAGKQMSIQRGKLSDFEAIQGKKVSITPLRLDMTQYSAVKTLQAWERPLKRLLPKK
ncbi:MAG: 5'/3'-nucleotidase SurE [Nitrospirae bacterium]|nr:5'/3'-nucleotidase SurE [Nitrospirota bacterium]